MKSIYIFLFFWFLRLFSSESFVSGYLKQYNYSDISGFFSDISFTNQKYSKDDFIYDRGGLALQIRFNNDIEEDVYYNAIMEINYDFKIADLEPDSLNSDGITVFFKEGYIGLRDLGGFLDLKVGRQYIFWGKFEWGGALDIISAWNFMSMSAEKENYRLAVDALKADFAINDNLSFETIFIPVHPVNKLELPGNIGNFQRKKNSTVNRSIKSTEIGLKILWEFEDFDFSLNYFKGFDRNFSLIFDFADSCFYPEYKPLKVLGIDFEGVFGDTVWLFEAAYYDTADDDGKDISIKNKNIKSAFGFEKDFFNNFSLSLQLSYIHLFDYDRQLEYDTLSPFTGKDIFVSRKDTYTLIYRLRYNINAMNSLQFLGSSDLFDLNTMNLFFMSSNITSTLKTYIGVINFRGKKGSRFGRLEELSRFFAELRYSF